jgi:hypothetical protein
VIFLFILDIPAKLILHSSNATTKQSFTQFWYVLESSVLELELELYHIPLFFNISIFSHFLLVKN